MDVSIAHAKTVSPTTRSPDRIACTMAPMGLKSLELAQDAPANMSQYGITLFR